MTTPEASAQDLSQVFETVKQRVQSYNSEKKQLADSLRQIVTSAQELLGQLGESVSPSVRRGRPPGARKRGRPAKAAKRGPGRPAKKGKRGRPAGSKLSAEARKRISEAQKARWAAKRKTAEK